MVTHWTDKCELMIDGRQVDSAAVPAFGGTTKLQDTADGTTVNVTAGYSLRPKVTLLANGEEMPLSRQ